MKQKLHDTTSLQKDIDFLKILACFFAFIVFKLNSLFV